MSEVKRLLVLCTGNRCRSQMAEGWLRYFAGARAEVCSAGTSPKGVHPLAVRVMAEAGVDIGDQTSDHVDRYRDQRFDLVVTVCDNARQACPSFANAQRTLHHRFDDPDEPGLSHDDQLAMFRRVRDEIRQWAEALARSI